MHFFFLFGASPVAYGSFQARGQLGTTAASLHHSHSNTRSELHLQPMLQLVAMLVLNPLSHNGNSHVCIFSFFLSFFFFLFFCVTLVAYGSSWARGQIRAAATAALDLRCICDVRCSLQQCRIHNQLS